MRDFRFNLVHGDGGFHYRSRTADFALLVRAAHTWLTPGSSVVDIEPLVDRAFFDSMELAHRHRDAVAVQWHRLRSLTFGATHDVVEAAFLEPRLRVLHPTISHGSLQFSRFACYPYSNDLPMIFPGRGDDEWTAVLDAAWTAQIHGLDACAVVAAVVAHLPPGVGPASEEPHDSGP